MKRNIFNIAVWIVLGLIPFQLYAGSDNIAFKAWATVSDSLNSETGAKNLIDGKIMYDGNIDRT